MKLEDFQNITAEILQNHTDQAKVSLLLKQLSDDYPVVLSENEEAKKTAETLTQANETLRSANMELFLSMGGKKQTSHSDPKPTTTEEKPLKVEDLLDGKGNFKLD